MHTVYVYRDSTGEVLYVGVTQRGHTRTREHAKRLWWPLVDSATFTHFMDRDAAESHEQHLIRLYRPPHNVTHNPWHEYALATYTADAHIEWATGE